MTASASSSLVSVLVTTYNHAPYVEEALDALRCQTSGDFEVIITDDASTDGCADVIETWLARTSYPALFIRNSQNRGICANRNSALARASGAFVCSLSGDDCYEPRRIERQLACFLTQPPQVAAVYSDMSVVDFEGRRRDQSFLEAALKGVPPPQGDLFTRILAFNFLPAPAVMLRRSAIAAVGGYDESLSFEDLDMWLRLSFRFKFIYLPGSLVRYRKLESSLSHSSQGRRVVQRSQTEILKKWLNAGPSEETHSLVLNGLLRNGVTQLLSQDDAGARETFNVVVSADARLHRRLLAKVGMLPGACMAARTLARIRRGYLSFMAQLKLPKAFAKIPA